MPLRATRNSGLLRSTLILVFAATLAVGFGALDIGQRAMGDDETPSPVIQHAMRTVGPMMYENACNECHRAETRAWKATEHYTSFDDMHTTDRAKEIAKKMGVRSIKRSETCAKCHYTSKYERRLKPLWGVSCESCHGAGKDFVDIHPYVGGDMDKKGMRPGKSKSMETPQLRQQRLAHSANAGMIHSEMIYEIARSCVECHLVPDPKLVDVGGHPLGGKFELVTWLNGDVRHNFVSSRTGKENRELSTKKKRMYYIVGTMVDLEVTLKCFVMTKNPGRFKTEMIARANRLLKRAAAIREAIKSPQFEAVFAAIPQEFDDNTYVEAGVPEQLGRVTRQFAADHDGAKLDSIDELLSSKQANQEKAYNTAGLAIR